VTRRRVLAVIAAAAALLAIANALVYSLYRDEVRTVSGALDDRLLAIGRTAAKWIATGTDAQPGLEALVGENRLEDAYLIDRDRRVRAGVRTRAGTMLNLLRADADRLADARRGTASSGHGYSIENAEVEVAYFPIDGGTTVLALEAGAEYRAPAAALRATYLLAAALTVVVAIVFATALVLALRALERSRVAHGRAERLAGVGQMAAMVAHEVRNPLGVLRGQVELAREKLGDAAPARERERFAEMISEIERLNRLTEEFLALARDLPIERAPVELTELARGIVDEARVAAPNAKIEAAGDAVTIAGDAARLRQAIYNLVLNAAQIGGDGVAVRVEIGRAHGRARVDVVDDGPGVPAALADKLFEPFVGARPGGSGLGLAIARRVVERHGGTIVLASTPGVRGARFTLELPLT
jgi:signal transduction histidine kinase